MDFVGRYENIEEDFKILCQKMNCENIQLPLVNTTRHRHYSRYYTDETREIVAELFRNDIRIFGYEFERYTFADEIISSIKKVL